MARVGVVSRASKRISNRKTPARNHSDSQASAHPPNERQHWLTRGSGSCRRGPGYRLRNLIGAEIRMMPDIIPAIPTPSATRKLRHRRLSQHCSEMSSKRGAEQICSQDRLGLTQTGWPLRHPPDVPSPSPRRAHSRRWEGHRGATKQMGILTVNDLQALELATLEAQYGRMERGSTSWLAGWIAAG